MSDETPQNQALGQGLRQMVSQPGLAPFGLRNSGEAPKGMGYFGAVPNPNGGMSSELSAESEVNGKNMEYPLMVPTLTAPELQSVLGGTPSDEIYRKALAHALYRSQQGMSPFAGPTDLRMPPP